MRAWVHALPRLDGPDRDIAGGPVPFARDRITPYAFRHSFAQRHADAGTPVDTLKELLGHDTIRMALGYSAPTGPGSPPTSRPSWPAWPATPPPSSSPPSNDAPTPEPTMTERTDRLLTQRRLDSQDKTRRLLAALQAVIDAGAPATIAALARRANVSRRFVYDHPELRAEAERLLAHAADRHTAGQAATARVSAASLPPADLANAKAANQRLQVDLAALRRRLGQQLGRQALADLDHQTAEPALSPRLTELEQSLLEAREQLARRTEELDTARQINRDLIARLNRDHR